MNNQEQNQLPVADRLPTGIGEQIRQTAGRLGESAARASEKSAETLDNIGKKLDDVCDSVIDKTKEYSRATDSYVRKNPWVAVGISAGFAFLAGVLIGRRRDG
jgi:ElaB/YqjD/DUF883 family membrane-anchored ribosome-binding protein